MTKEKNVGIEILRSLMCLGVIGVHFAHSGFPVSVTRNLPVPIFMFLSFFLCGNKILGSNKSDLARRLRRILLPYFLWPFFYMYGYSVAQQLFHTSNPTFNNLSSFELQLLTGCAFAAHFWFLWDLAFFTLVVYGIGKLKEIKKLNRGFVKIGGGISIIVFSIFMQYSLLNWNIFGNLPYEFRYPFGRICEMIPFAVGGLYFSKIGIPARYKNIRLGIALSFMGLFFVLSVFDIPRPSKGFGYSGIGLMLQTWFLAAFFIIFPFEILLPDRMRSSVILISRYTMGIYCCHMFVGHYIDEMCRIKGFDFHCSFVKSLLIYIICWFLCRLISRIPFKLCKQMVI